MLVDSHLPVVANSSTARDGKQDFRLDKSVAGIDKGSEDLQLLEQKKIPT